ncbi:MAG: DUF4918 family protein [bacterium]|nr:DUF4918 family protein [bacterium]
MTIADKLIEYYSTIEKPKKLIRGVELLYPFDQAEVIEAISGFYKKYLSDNNKRTLLIGINPGRLGGGITGIPFTDPIRLKEICGIDNDFDRKPELSSTFVYDMINNLGGPNEFYTKFLITSVCPLGFMKDGKNLNYYDDKKLEKVLEKYMLNNLKWHIELVQNDEICFSLGQGKNIAYLNYLNDKYKLFGKIEALPHPRWILQYRRKRLQEFLDLYKEKLSL